jgi:hypothetical protein
MIADAPPVLDEIETRLRAGERPVRSMVTPRMSVKIAFRRKAAISASRRRRLAEVPWFRSAIDPQTPRHRPIDVESETEIRRAD